MKLKQKEYEGTGSLMGGENIWPKLFLPVRHLKGIQASAAISFQKSQNVLERKVMPMFF
jgi:hypothetical protein